MHLWRRRLMTRCWGRWLILVRELPLASRGRMNDESLLFYRVKVRVCANVGIVMFSRHYRIGKTPISGTHLIHR